MMYYYCPKRVLAKGDLGSLALSFRLTAFLPNFFELDYI